MMFRSLAASDLSLLAKGDALLGRLTKEHTDRPNEVRNGVALQVSANN